MVRSSILSDASIEDPGVPAGGDYGGNRPIQAKIARLLINALAERCSRYCILTGYESLPDKVNTDIDFMVDPSDFRRVPALLGDISAEMGVNLFQVVPHEVSGCAFFLVTEDKGTVTFVQPDSCSDYRHFGKLWLHADEVLGSRRWHDCGFWIPSASSEFTYYLIKRINKLEITTAHASKLSRLYTESPGECNLWLNRFWGKRSAEALAEMAESADWSSLVNGLEAYRHEMRRHSRKAFSFGASTIHVLDRILRPTGGWIAFIGPDGCGKSAVIETVAADFAPAFQRVMHLHLRPKVLPAKRGNDVPVTNPHGQPVRGNLYSIAKILYLVLDYWLGYFRQVRSRTVRSGLVIFDRYFYDILVDPERVLYGGPRWLLKLLGYLIPRPEIVFLLNARPEALWARKQEVPYEEVARQQREFLELAHLIRGAIVIDANRPLQQVRCDVQKAIIEHFSLRTKHRLKLGSGAKKDVLK